MPLAPQVRLPEWTVKISWQLDPNRGQSFLFRLESFECPMVPQMGSLDGWKKMPLFFLVSKET